MLKIFSTEKIFQSHALPTGTLVCEDKQTLKVALHDGFLLLKEIQLAGKKRMQTTDFLRGFRVEEGMHLE